MDKVKSPTIFVEAPAVVGALQLARLVDATLTQWCQPAKRVRVRHKVHKPP
jgi:hypothetical protein